MKLTAALALSILAETVYGVADHLWYHTDLSNVTDFYNEVNVVPGAEPISTYFMTNGFTGGYFGVQHNTEGKTGKTVLFSVWDNDDGTKTTQQYCGKSSRCSTFGGEGTGLHANYDFQWTAGVTYTALIHAKPLNNGYTDISGYFRHENKEWYHLATYRRKTDSPYLSGLYSFVENPSSYLINETRRANYGNQWVRNSANKAQELTVADLTHTTLVDSDRYGSGAKGTSFYLFIDGPTNDIPSKTTITRKATGVKPDFDMKGSKGSIKSTQKSHSKRKTTSKHKSEHKKSTLKKSKTTTTKHKSQSKRKSTRKTKQ
ncbi:hypothetical protein BC943DRAFT_362449 [Umbelopsis sp. AD052]|nr:hypothetical protein BC943DRAFT_362449 [Umbelopsis sp. AD052]